MFTILDYSSALEYSIIRRYTNIVFYYYYYIPSNLAWDREVPNYRVVRAHEYIHICIPKRYY